MVPGPADDIDDGLIPQTFYTYQIVYLPDTNKEYGLRIKGSTAGETRANINLVNGWQMTGPGPYYTRNSSTAENATAIAGGVGQVTGAIGQALSQFFPSGAAGKVATALGGATPAPSTGSGTTLTSLQAGPATNLKLHNVKDYAETYMFSIDFVNGQWVLTSMAPGAGNKISFTRQVYAIETQPQPSNPPTQNPTTASVPPDAATIEIQNDIRSDREFNDIDPTKITTALAQGSSFTITVERSALPAGKTFADPERSDLVAKLKKFGDDWLHAHSNAGLSGTTAVIVPTVGTPGTGQAATAPAR